LNDDWVSFMRGGRAGENPECITRALIKLKANLSNYVDSLWLFGYSNVCNYWDRLEKGDGEQGN